MAKNMMNLQRLLGIAFGFMLLCGLSEASTIYKTVQADGTVIYSDVASPGAVAVELSSTAAVIPKLADGTLSTSVPQKKAPVNYKVTFHSPLAEETIRSNLGEVNVHFEISPEYLGIFELTLDNQVVKTNSKNQLTLNDVPRGRHVLQVNLIDNSGKILASSKPQTFYLHKASALINAN
jgi:hypothetical protein